MQDVATLEIISGRFLKDKKQVYYGQAAIKGSDPQSFRLLNEYYTQDTAHVYYYTYSNEDDKGIIKTKVTLSSPPSSSSQHHFH